MSRPAKVALLALAAVALPSAAHAHLVTTGMGPFYDGILHLLVSPADLMGVFALSLLAGLAGARAGRLLVLILPLAWLLCGLASQRLATPVDGGWVGALSLVVLGGLVALDADLPAEAIGLLAALYGALEGWTNGSALAAVGGGWASLLGITVGVSIVALSVSAGVVRVRAAWFRIAVRVAGSWIAAVGVLLIGWLIEREG